MHVEHKGNHENLLDHKKIATLQVNKFNNCFDLTTLLDYLQLMKP